VTNDSYYPGGRRQQPCSHRLWAILICLVGFALLVYQLDAKSLWGDETYRVGTTDVTLGDVQGFIKLVERHVLPPLYPAILWAWRSITGDTEFALRFPSVAFATISLAMMYRLGVCVLGRPAGLAALALAATSPFLILSARMVQYYSLLLLLSAASYWFFFELLRGRGTRVKWVGYIAVCTMAMYAQYLAAFVMASQGVVALTLIRKRRAFLLGFCAAQALVLLLFAPAIGILSHQSAGRFAQQDAFTTSSIVMSAVALFYPFFGWTVGGSIYPWNPLGLLGALIGLSLAVVGLWAVATDRYADPYCQSREKPTDPGKPARRAHGQPVGEGRLGGRVTALACAVFILLPLCLTVLVIRGVPGASGDPFVGNRAVFCVPFLFLLIAAGIVAIGRRSLRGGAVALLALAFGVSLLNYYQGREFHNPLYVLQTDQLAAIVHEKAQPGDVFVSDEMTTFGYYIVKTDSDATHFNATAAEDARDYIERHNPESVWLILLCRAVETESPATILLLPWLREQGYHEELSFGHSPQDATMARVQELALGRPACTYKIIVSKYTRT
jgi:4-amino-4-deoxy-L-arabinose transferase-like glycosyltransferase